MSCKEINTYHIKNTTTGINHVEGGWPKDISYMDQEQTVRYRKKAEREETYIPAMNHLCKLMEECIEQNNSIDIYVRYFSKEPVVEYHPEVSAVVAGNMRDPSGQNRAVSCVSWCPMDSTERVLVSHCDLDFMEVMKTCNDSYIWRIENPFQPESVLSGTSPMLTMECNYKDINLVAGGQHNGQVVFFDTRKSVKPTGLTEKTVSHLEPVHSLMWIQSKTGFECFSTSTDGQVLWWDMRNMNESTDQMIIDHTRSNNLAGAEGGMVLEYSNTVPTKFMVGTEKGNVYSCTRKAKSPADKMGQAYSEHIGPVYLLQRNPFLYKLFLTVGDYHANIWAEDFAHAPIWKTPLYNSHVLHGGWSPPRPSVFFITKSDGTFDIWDLMNKQKGPEYTLKLTEKRLFCMSVEEKGEFVAVGSETGETFILQLSSEVFEPQNKEKNFFTSLIDRESRREKFLFDKEKDRKLAKTVLVSRYDRDLTKEREELKEVLDNTTEVFFQTIAEEMKRLQRLKKTDPMDMLEMTKDECEDMLDEEEESDEDVESDKGRSMPSDPDLPLYQVESFAVEDKPDKPLDKFVGTIHRKRFKIGHCADIPYPPEQDISFRVLKQSDCPALMPTKSAPDDDYVRMKPEITKVLPSMVFVKEVEVCPAEPILSEERLPSAYLSVKDVRVRDMSHDTSLEEELRSGSHQAAWIEPVLAKRAAPDKQSVDIQSLGFRFSHVPQDEIIGGTGAMKLEYDDRKKTMRSSDFSLLKANKVTEDLFSSSRASGETKRASKKSQTIETRKQEEVKKEAFSQTSLAMQAETSSKMVAEMGEDGEDYVPKRKTIQFMEDDFAETEVEAKKELEKVEGDVVKVDVGALKAEAESRRIRDRAAKSELTPGAEEAPFQVPEEIKVETQESSLSSARKSDIFTAMVKPFIGETKEQMEDETKRHSQRTKTTSSADHSIKSETTGPEFGIKYISQRELDVSVHTQDMVVEASKTFEEALSKEGVSIRTEKASEKFVDRSDDVDFGAKVDKVESVAKREGVDGSGKTEDESVG